MFLAFPYLSYSFCCTILPSGYLFLCCICSIHVCTLLLRAMLPFSLTAVMPHSSLMANSILDWEANMLYSRNKTSMCMMLDDVYNSSLKHQPRTHVSSALPRSPLPPLPSQQAQWWYSSDFSVPNAIQYSCATCLSCTLFPLLGSSLSASVHCD